MIILLRMFWELRTYVQCTIKVLKNNHNKKKGKFGLILLILFWFQSIFKSTYTNLFFVPQFFICTNAQQLHERTYIILLTFYKTLHVQKEKLWKVKTEIYTRWTELKLSFTLITRYRHVLEVTGAVQFTLFLIEVHCEK